jgi:hypothetical protein
LEKASTPQSGKLLAAYSQIFCHVSWQVKTTLPALYIIPLIGVTHILGSVGLLIPKMPRLTEWVYAGFAITLLLDFYSQLNSAGRAWDKFDPILVAGFVFASYVLRRSMRANSWSI